MSTETISAPLSITVPTGLSPLTGRSRLRPGAPTQSVLPGAHKWQTGRERQAATGCAEISWRDEGNSPARIDQGDCRNVGTKWVIKRSPAGGGLYRLGAGSIPVQRTQLQLLASACLLLASKLHDPRPLTAPYPCMSYRPWRLPTKEI